MSVACVRIFVTPTKSFVPSPLYGPPQYCAIKWRARSSQRYGPISIRSRPTPLLLNRLSKTMCMRPRHGVCVTVLWPTASVGLWSFFLLRAILLALPGSSKTTLHTLECDFPGTTAQATSASDPRIRGYFSQPYTRRFTLFLGSGGNATSVIGT